LAALAPIQEALTFLNGALNRRENVNKANLFIGTPEREASLASFVATHDGVPLKHIKNGVEDINGDVALFREVLNGNNRVGTCLLQIYERTDCIFCFDTYI